MGFPSGRRAELRRAAQLRWARHSPKTRAVQTTGRRAFLHDLPCVRALVWGPKGQFLVVSGAKWPYGGTY